MLEYQVYYFEDGSILVRDSSYPLIDDGEVLATFAYRGDAVMFAVNLDPDLTLIQREVAYQAIETLRDTCASIEDIEAALESVLEHL